MPRFYGKDKNLTVYAPPPAWFTATLDKLRLNFDLEAAMSSDKINRWKDGPPRNKKRSQAFEILPPKETVVPNDVRNPLLN